MTVSLESLADEAMATMSNLLTGRWPPAVSVSYGESVRLANNYTVLELTEHSIRSNY